MTNVSIAELTERIAAKLGPEGVERFETEAHRLCAEYAKPEDKATVERVIAGYLLGDITADLVKAKFLEARAAANAARIATTIVGDMLIADGIAERKASQMVGLSIDGLANRRYYRRQAALPK